MNKNITPTLHKIAYYETDRMGCTHHSNYIRFMEEARMDFFDQLGWGYGRMEQEGIVSPVVDVSGQYRLQTTFDDVLEIHTALAGLSAAKLTLTYTMYRKGQTEQPVFLGKSSHCFLDEKGRLVSIKKKYPELYLLLTELMEENK